MGVTYLAGAAAAVAVVLIVLLTLVVQRRRLDRRFARRLSPYARSKGATGQVLDAEEWTGNN